MQLQKSTVLNSMLAGKVFRLTEVPPVQQPDEEKKGRRQQDTRILWPSSNKGLFRIHSEQSGSPDPLLQTLGSGSQFHTPKAENRFSFPHLYSQSFRRESHPTLPSSEQYFTLDSLKRELSTKGFASKRRSKPDSKLNRTPSERSDTRLEDAPRLPDQELLAQIRRLNTVQSFAELEADLQQSKHPDPLCKPSDTGQRVDISFRRKPKSLKPSKFTPFGPAKKSTAEGSTLQTQKTRPKEPALSRDSETHYLTVLPQPKTYCKDLGFRVQDLEVYKKVQRSPDSRRRENLLKLKRSTSIELNSMLRVEKNVEVMNPQQKQKSMRDVQPDPNTSIMHDKPILQRQQTLFELSSPPKPTTKWRLPEDSKLDLKIRCDPSGRYYVEVDNPEAQNRNSTRERLLGQQKAGTSRGQYDPEYFETCQSIISELKELKNMGCDDALLADTITRDTAHDSNIMKLLFENHKLRKNHLDDLLLLIKRGVKTDLSKVIIRYQLIYQGQSTRQYLDNIPKVTQAELEKRKEYRKRLALAEIKQEDRLALPKILSRLTKLKLRLQMNVVVEKVERVFRSEANRRTLEIAVDQFQSLHGAMSGAASEAEHLTAAKPLFSLEKKRREVDRLREKSAGCLRDLRELVEMVVEGRFRGTRKVVERANELINFCLSGKDLAAPELPEERAD